MMSRRQHIILMIALCLWALGFNVAQPAVSSVCNNFAGGTDNWGADVNLTPSLNNSFTGTTMHNMVFISGGPAAVFYGFDSGPPPKWNIYYSSSIDNWTQYTKISNCSSCIGLNSSKYPSIALDHSNNIQAVWMAEDGSAINDIEIFYSAFKDGAWAAPLNISNNEVDDYYPDIVSDSSSHIHISWFKENGEKYELKYLEGFSGVWLANETVKSNITLNYSKGPSLAVSGDRTIGVAYTERNESYHEVNSIVVVEKVSRNWVMSRFTYNLSNVIIPQIKYDGAGNLHLIYINYNYSTLDYGVFYMLKTGAGWGQPLNISSSKSEVEYASFDIDVNGRIHIVYSQRDDSYLEDYELFYLNNTRGSFMIPENITANDINDHRPSITLDSDGYAHILYYLSLDDRNYVSYIKSLNQVSVTSNVNLVVILIIAGTVIVLSVSIFWLKVKEKWHKSLR